MSLISINNLTFGYEGSYKNIFENVTFNIDTDWKLGLIGRNGKGKTTFINLLQGKSEPILRSWNCVQSLERSDFYTIGKDNFPIV